MVKELPKDYQDKDLQPARKIACTQIYSSTTLTKVQIVVYKQKAAGVNPEFKPCIGDLPVTFHK